MFASRRKEPPPSAHSFSSFWDIALCALQSSQPEKPADLVFRYSKLPGELEKSTLA
jgi:hypothetical protein